MNIERLTKVLGYAFNKEQVELSFIHSPGAAKEIGCDWYVEGFFNPYFEEDNEIAIELNVIGDIAQDIKGEEKDLFIEEVFKAYYHEMIHLEQYRNGTFIFDWEGSYEDNPNEIEAYAREGEWINNNKKEK